MTTRRFRNYCAPVQLRGNIVANRPHLHITIDSTRTLKVETSPIIDLTCPVTFTFLARSIQTNTPCFKTCADLCLTIPGPRTFPNLGLVSMSNYLVSPLTFPKCPLTGHASRVSHLTGNDNQLDDCHGVSVRSDRVISRTTRDVTYNLPINDQQRLIRYVCLLAPPTYLKVHFHKGGVGGGGVKVTTETKQATGLKGL